MCGWGGTDSPLDCDKDGAICLHDDIIIILFRRCCLRPRSSVYVCMCFGGVVYIPVDTVH